MSLFDDVQSEKRRDEIEPIGNQPCTQLLYFTLDEREEFKKLIKAAIKLEMGVEATKSNISDFILTKLRSDYGDSSLQD